jgi:hypothetical protein
MPRFLDDENRFLRGRFKDELLDDVIDEEPEYPEWLLENCDLAPEEAAAVREALGLDEGV